MKKTSKAKQRNIIAASATSPSEMQPHGESDDLAGRLAAQAFSWIGRPFTIENQSRYTMDYEAAAMPRSESFSGLAFW